MANRFSPQGRRRAVSGWFATAALLTTSCLVLAGAATAQFLPLDLGNLLNTDRDHIFSGNLLPIGRQEYGGVPFRLTFGKSYAWTPPDDAKSDRLEIPVNVYGVHTVYTLINTKWGQTGPKSLATIEFYGTGNLVHSVELVGGEHIRDYHPNNRFAQTINGTTTVEAFKHKRGLRLDRQRFVLPAKFQSDTLRMITLVDRGAKDVQRLLLMGVTVEVPVPVADQPVVDAALPLQGEYVFELEGGEDAAKLGLQVVALGGDALRAVTFHGGLPGAGWNGSPRATVDSTIADGRAKFARAAYTITIADDSATIAAPNGRTMGQGNKVNRKSPTLGASSPTDATVLFDGSANNDFMDGRLAEDGSLLAGATSDLHFRDCRLHVEFRMPYQPKARGRERGNSGVFLQGRYEVQILDSFGMGESDVGCGSVGRNQAPSVNMCLPPNAWQTFDVDFVAAKYDGDRKIAQPRVTVRHNGVVVQDNVALPETSLGRLLSEGPNTGPLWLQPHGEPVSFRNIWLAPYEVADQPEPDRGDRMPAVGDFARFLNQREKAAEAARRRLLQSIDIRARQIRRSDLPVDKKRLALDAIQSDRDAFTTQEKLPNADELIDLVLAFVEDCQRILDNCESFRQQQAERAVSLDDSDAKRRLEGIEQRVRGVIGGRDSFTQGSNWHGKWQRPDRAFEMNLRVDKIAGNAFTGELVQIGDFGRPDRMNLEGELDGNRIQMRTTGMIRGKNRVFSFRGYLLGSRIVAAVDGTTTDNKRATGWLSLSRQ